MGPGITIALDVILQLLDRSAAIGALIGKAQQEKRDLTEAELNSLAAVDDLARAKVQALIDAAKK